MTTGTITTIKERTSKDNFIEKYGRTEYLLKCRYIRLRNLYRIKSDYSYSTKKLKS